MAHIYRLMSVCVIAGATALPAWAEGTENCLYARDLDQFEVLNNEMILIHGKVGKIWLNRLASRCAGLRDNMYLSVERSGSQVCANDRITARRPGDSGPAARCRLGKFEVLSKEQIPALKQSLAES